MFYMQLKIDEKRQHMSDLTTAVNTKKNKLSSLKTNINADLRLFTSFVKENKRKTKNALRETQKMTTNKSRMVFQEALDASWRAKMAEPWKQRSKLKNKHVCCCSSIRLLTFLLFLQYLSSFFFNSIFFFEFYYSIFFFQA